MLDRKQNDFFYELLGLRKYLQLTLILKFWNIDIYLQFLYAYFSVFKGHDIKRSSNQSEVAISEITFTEQLNQVGMIHCVEQYGSTFARGIKFKDKRVEPLRKR